MSPFARWLLYFWVYLIVFCTIIVTVNAMVDPFGDQERWVEQKFKPILDTDKRKYNYVFSQNRAGQYDGVIVGSSRIMLIHPNKTPVVGKAYNFGISSATLGQNLFVIKEWIRTAGPELKYVLLGIDFFAFDSRADVSSMREVQENFTGHNNNYAAYLLSFDTLELSMKALQNRYDGEVLHYFQEDGGFVYATRDRDIEKGIYDHSDLRMYTDGQLRYLSFENMKYNPNGLEYLRQIKALCEQNGTRLIPFVTPEQRMLFGFLGSNPVLHRDYLRLRKDLLQVFDQYYDFGGMNSINNSGTHFYDTIHYRTYVGAYIANRVFGVADPRIPADYGTLVTRQNVDGHVRKLDSQLQSAANMITGSMMDR